jgi:hypothetical protein
MFSTLRRRLVDILDPASQAERDRQHESDLVNAREEAVKKFLRDQEAARQAEVDRLEAIRHNNAALPPAKKAARCADTAARRAEKVRDDLAKKADAVREEADKLAEEVAGAGKEAQTLRDTATNAWADVQRLEEELERLARAAPGAAGAASPEAQPSCIASGAQAVDGNPGVPGPVSAPVGPKVPKPTGTDIDAKVVTAGALWPLSFATMCQWGGGQQAAPAPGNTSGPARSATGCGRAKGAEGLKRATGGSFSTASQAAESPMSGAAQSTSLSEGRDHEGGGNLKRPRVRQPELGLVEEVQ